MRCTALWSTFGRVVPWRCTTSVETWLCGLALDKFFSLVLFCGGGCLRTSRCGVVTMLVACSEWLCFCTQTSAFYKNMVWLRCTLEKNSLMVTIEVFE